MNILRTIQAAFSKTGSGRAEKRANGKLGSGRATMGTQFAPLTLTYEDVDEVLRRASLQRSDLLKLLYDDEIAGCIDRRVSGVLGNNWHIEGDKDNWIYNIVEGIHDAAVRCILQAKWIGSSIGEIIYQPAENGITIAQIIPRPIEQFKRTADGLEWNSPSGEKVAVSPEKVIYSGVNVHDANPYGDALLSRVYWAWFNKNYGEQFWSKYAERHASPLTILKTPVPTLDEHAARHHFAEMAAAMAQAVSAGVIAIDNLSEVSFAEASSDGEAHVKFVRYQIQRIQKTILGRVLNSELASGSRAAQEADDRFYQDIGDSDLDFCEKGLNHLVRCLLEINGLSSEGIYFTYDRKNLIDPNRWQRDVALLGTGKIEFTSQYFLDNYGLETNHFAITSGNNGSAQFSLSLSKAGEELENRLNARPLPEDDAILQLVQSAKDENDLIIKLSHYYGEAQTAEFEEALTQALMMAEAQGYADGIKGQV